MTPQTEQGQLWLEFLEIYARAGQANLSAREIEKFTSSWSAATNATEADALQIALQASILAQSCAANGHLYESIAVKLGLIRALVSWTYTSNINDLAVYYMEVMRQIHRESATYLETFGCKWREANRDMLGMDISGLDMVTYLVKCARLLELACLALIAEQGLEPPVEISGTLQLLEELVTHEPGCVHPVSDRYAVSIWWTVALLRLHARPDAAEHVTTQVTKWLCDRVDGGLGFASVEAPEIMEASYLFGSDLGFKTLERAFDSFLATSLADSAAAADDHHLYEIVVNDILATGVRPVYWTIPDTDSAGRLDSDEIIWRSAVTLNGNLVVGKWMEHGDHLNREPDSYHFVDRLGIGASMALSLLMRDRYFPRLIARMIVGGDGK